LDTANQRQNVLTRFVNSTAFVVGPPQIRELNKLGLERIANLIDRDQVNEYEAMLLRAIRWFAKGEREQNADDRKLCYVTAIDLFFSARGSGATKRLCKGFAFAMSKEASAVPGLATFMRDAFASRSDTVHEGHINIATEDELRDLRDLTLNFIIRMNSFHFSSKAECLLWSKCQEEKLSADINTALNAVFKRPK
jgi:hypothetical protein